MDIALPERSPEEHDIQPGMQVEAERGDLGERDISKPRVWKVIRDRWGNIRKVIVTKGVLSPSLVVLILFLGNKRAVMKEYRFGTPLNVALALMALVMFAASALLIYGLLTGQAS